MAATGAIAALKQIKKKKKKANKSQNAFLMSWNSFESSLYRAQTEAHKDRQRQTRAIV